MAILNDTARTANFLISEAPSYGSREAGLIGGGAAVPVGTLLAKSATGVGAANLRPGAVGNGTISAVTLAAGAQTGTYTATFTSPTAFTVRDPFGAMVASGTTGTAFNTQIGFTITAGGTAFAIGDVWNIGVDITEYRYTVWASGAVGGILFETLSAADAVAVPVPERTVIARDAEVQLSGLIFPGGQAAAIDALNAVGIAVRRH